MVARIQKLPVQLANQIAAGEVVERPASVVKELVENSIDAGATQIQIDIEKGGLRAIRIRDNGHGITKEDLTLALSPHATSKIREFHDLQSIASLGFRGEALASIASVSRLTLTSKAESADAAWRAKVAGREMEIIIDPASHPQGTTIDVEDLFFNTPARRNFLRTEKTEFNHIEDIIKKIALSHFQVGFVLRHNQKDVLRCPVVSPENGDVRVRSICGDRFLKNARFVEFSAVGFKLWGWLGNGEIARSQTDLQYFYVNQRVIRDRLVNHAVRQAYEGLLYEGRHPCYVLFLDIEPEMVDVNVHPTKHEVRFRDSRLVHDFIAQQLAEGLHVSAQSPAVTTTETPQLPLESRSVEYAPIAPHQTLVSAPASSSISHTIGQFVARESQPTTFAKPSSITPPQEKLPELEPYFTIGERFIVMKQDAGIKIYDMQQVRCRFAEEKFAPALKEGTVISQPLLIPETIKLTEKIIDKLEGSKATFEQCGLSFSILGEDSIVVRKVPGFMRKMDIDYLFSQLQDLCTKKSDFSVADLTKQLAQAYATDQTLTYNDKELQSLLHWYNDNDVEQGSRALSLKELAEFF